VIIEAGVRWEPEECEIEVGYYQSAHAYVNYLSIDGEIVKLSCDEYAALEAVFTTIAQRRKEE
jgi:hypothetical protein